MWNLTSKNNLERSDATVFQKKRKTLIINQLQTTVESANMDLWTYVTPTQNTCVINVNSISVPSTGPCFLCILVL